MSRQFARLDGPGNLLGTMSSRRSRIIQRSEVRHDIGAPRKTSRSQEDQHDRAVARSARNQPSMLHSWITRVDGRFFGIATNIHPHEAIMKAISITHGEVLYCDAQIARLHEDELFERPLHTTIADMPDGSTTMITERRDAETVSRWVSFRQNAVDRLARYSKMALDIGIEEAQLHLAEREADMVTRYFDAVMNDINLSPDQRRLLGPAMHKHLELIEGETSD